MIIVPKTFLSLFCICSTQSEFNKDITVDKTWFDLTVSLPLPPVTDLLFLIKDYLGLTLGRGLRNLVVKDAKCNELLINLINELFKKLLVRSMI